MTSLQDTGQAVTARIISPELHEKRERVFLILAGTFLSAMTMLNLIGITRFIEIGPLAVAVGVLPYPITFLCTDLISELYGRARANFLVTVGLGLNIWITKQIGLQLNSTAKIGLIDFFKSSDYMQHGLGIVIRIEEFEKTDNSFSKSRYKVSKKRKKIKYGGKKKGKKDT